MGVIVPDDAGRQSEARRVWPVGAVPAVPASAIPSWTAADFDAFAVAATPRLLRMSRSMGAGLADAEDATAEALARAYASWPRVASMASPEGWVLRIAANLVCDRARRTRREPLSGGPSDHEPVAVGFEDLLANRAELLDALRCVPRRLREAVVLRYLGGLSLKDVATVQGVSRAAASKRVERGVAVLRGLLRAGGTADHREEDE